MNYLLPPRLDALAREYVLGTMAGGARRRFERLLRDRPAATIAVTAWQARFDTLAESVPPRTPRPAVWESIEQRLFAPRAAPARMPPWWRRLLSAPALGGALAGLLVGTVVLRQQPGWVGLEPAQETLPQSYVGLLLDTEGKPALLASSRRHGQLLTVKILRPLEIPPGRVARLWALPANGGAPLAIGAVPTRGSATIALSDSAETLFFGVSRLAVSFETAPGGPQPSTDFVLSGACVKLW